MNYEGERFLLQLYRELYDKQSVKHSGTESDNKYELIKKYLKRLERSEKVFDGEHKELEQYMKNRYYDKYVIKEEDIPESYWQLKDKISFERGEGHINYKETIKQEEAHTIIENQKKSLDKWLNYLMKENASYPMWTRYWAFQGMIKLGKYDKEKHSFSKRSKGTVSPFIELNAEALAHTIRTVQSYYEGHDIDDDELKQLVESGNFGKIYSYNIWKQIEEEKKNNKDKIETNNGVWKMFAEGEEKKLIKLLDGKGTGWCIAEEETAKHYLEKGNMHIYFTKDKKGKYTMPRVCIRQEYDEIAEVRGIEKDQTMEDEMLNITDKKLDEFDDKEEYKKKVSDMRKLTDIYNKFKNTNKLSDDDLRFLYEIDDSIEGFGWEEDPRIEELRNLYGKIDDEKILLDFLKSDSDILRYASDRLRDNENIMLTAVNLRGRNLQYASDRLKDNENIVLVAVNQNGDSLEYASDRLKDDEHIVLTAVKHSKKNGSIEYTGPDCLEYASDRLRDKENIMLTAVNLRGRNLQYASDRLKDNENIVLVAVNQNGDSLEYASDRLKDDEYIVLNAVSNVGGGSSLEYASDRLRDNEDIVFASVSEHGSSLGYASDRLRDNENIVQAAINQNGYAINYIGNNIKITKKLALKVVKSYYKAFWVTSIKNLYSNDKDVAIAAVRSSHGRAINFLGIELLKDKDFMIELIRQNIDYIDFWNVRSDILRNIIIKEKKKQMSNDNNKLGNEIQNKKLR